MYRAPRTNQKGHIKSPRGFTLIELLVVIAIIGILSAIVMASLSTVRAKARDGVRRAEISSAGSALQQYAVKKGTFAIDNTFNGVGWFSKDVAPRSVAKALVDLGYVSELIIDPLITSVTVDNVGGHYGYYRTHVGNSVALGVCLFAQLERPTAEDTNRFNVSKALSSSTPHANMNYGQCVR